MINNLISIVLGLLLFITPAAAQMNLLTGAGGKFKASTSSASVIQSIQTATITMAAGSGSGTATISAVDTAKTIVIWNGVNTNSASTANYARVAVRLAVTNSTTITATREATSTDSVTVAFTVVEFASGVNSIQSGTIAITATNTSNTATVSAVGANAFVLWLGSSVAKGGMTATGILSSVELTDSTTVTARCTSNATNTTTVAYMVVDLDTTIVSGVQQRSFSSTAASATDTDTITSLSTTETLLFYNGMVRAGTVDVDLIAYHQVLTNGTTVTETRSNNSSTTSRTHKYTAVTFAAAALNASVQRGTIALSAATSNTATISSVDTSKSFVNWGNFLSATGNANTVQPSLTLTNATTVTAAVNSAGSPTVSYEVIEFK